MLIDLLTKKFDAYVKKEDRKFHNQIFMQTYFATKENHTILIKSSNNFDQFLCLLWLVFSALILRRILMQCTLNMNDNGVCRFAYKSVVNAQFNKEYHVKNKRNVLHTYLCP